MAITIAWKLSPSHLSDLTNSNARTQTHSETDIRTQIACDDNFDLIIIIDSSIIYSHSFTLKYIQMEMSTQHLSCTMSFMCKICLLSWKQRNKNDYTPKESNSFIKLILSTRKIGIKDPKTNKQMKEKTITAHAHNCVKGINAIACNSDSMTLIQNWYSITCIFIITNIVGAGEKLTTVQIFYNITTHTGNRTQPDRRRDRDNTNAREIWKHYQ